MSEEKFYTFVEQVGNKIFHRYIEDGIRKIEVVSEFPISLYTPNPNGDFIGLGNEKLARHNFNNISAARDFVSSMEGLTEIYGQTSWVYQFISHTYPGKIEFDRTKYRVFTIDIEVVKDDGFPAPLIADAPITLITVKDRYSDKIMSFGFDADDRELYSRSVDEKEMLMSFIHWWQDNYPDIITGWNCMPVTNTIWKKDKIVFLDTASKKDELYDSYVEHIFPRSTKKPYILCMKNGMRVTSSKEHKFPCWLNKKGSFVDPYNTSLVMDELTVGQMMAVSETHDVFLKQIIRENTNRPLTYRQMILSNLEHLIARGFEAIIRDTEIVRKVTIMSAQSSWEHKKQDFWSIRNISNILSKKEVIRFIERSNTLAVYSPEINKSSFEINLDDVISEEDLWLAGIWYTDGTQSYHTEVSVCNNEESIILETNRVTKKYRNSKYKNKIPSRKGDGCFYVDVGLSKVWFLKLFIYEHVKSCSKKRINIELLSQLSKDQFNSFIAGCVDGDGSVNEQGVISLCNYNNDLESFVELLSWNGYFTTLRKTSCSWRSKDLSSKLKHPVKKSRAMVSNEDHWRRSSKSNRLSWIFVDNNSLLVKVDSIEQSSDNEVEMVDIKTSTGYFVSGSFETHNCDGFDIPYLVTRIRNQLGEKFLAKLSPFYNKTKNTIREINLQGNDTGYSILGITTLDYLRLYKKYSYVTLEQYTLNHVAYIELGEQKVDYSEVDSLNELYRTNFSKYLDYNIHDVVLVDRLDIKKEFIFLAITMTYIGKARHDDIWGPVKFWDVILYNTLLEQGIQIPPKLESSSGDGIIGAFVKDPKIGLQKWVVSFDLTSLYPSIIMSFNLSPETHQDTAKGNLVDTYIEKLLQNEFDNSSLVEEHLCVLANGATFRTDIHGVMPKKVKELFAERKKAKKEMLQIKQANELLEAKKSNGSMTKEDNELYDYNKNKISSLDALQMAIKIMLNSLYGAQANQYFRYFNRDIAEGITLTGQLIIQYTSARLNQFLNAKFNTKGVDYIIAGDTDSIFVSLETFVRNITKGRQVPDEKIVDVIDLFAKKEIEPFLVEIYEELTTKLNVFENMISMKREKIVSAGIWRAKKQYVVLVYDEEGVRFAEPKFKATGIEIVRSSTPEIVKKALKDAVPLIMKEDAAGLQQFVKDFRTKFMGSKPVDVAFPRGISDLDKWVEGDSWKKGAPIHVKASIVHNKLLKDKKIQQKVKAITNGTKIKFIMLKSPNPTYNNAVAFVGYIPPEFGLEEYIDWDTQFNNTFLHPLESLAKLANIEVVATNDIMSLFEDGDEGDYEYDDKYHEAIQQQITMKAKQPISKPKETVTTLESLFE